MTLLEVRDLRVSVAALEGRTSIVRGVSLSVDTGGSIAIVGESGSGKSLTAFALMGLLPPGGRIDAGSVLLDGKDLVGMRDRDLRKLRGAKISMVFQEPSTALNPVYTVGSQIAEAVRLHGDASRSQARALAESWLARVGMPSPKRALDLYPHELSGGMKQRALLAIALVAGPAVLIADEPTTSLDCTLEAQILELFSREREERKMALVLVSHDLATVAEVTERAYVFYAGQVVEAARTLDLLSSPAHPYSAKLVESIPDPLRYPARTLGAPQPRLPVLDGSPPRFSDLPAGCSFAPRCPKVFDRCRTEAPPLYKMGDRTVRCFLYDDAPSPAGEEEPSA